MERPLRCMNDTEDGSSLALLVVLAHAAFDAERGKDCLHFIEMAVRQLVTAPPSPDGNPLEKLSFDRHLSLGFSAITHSLLGPLRAQARVLNSHVLKGNSASWKRERGREMLARSLQEQNAVLERILVLVASLLEASGPILESPVQSQVFLRKVRADVLRYRCESDKWQCEGVAEENAPSSLLSACKEAYDEALVLAREQLPTSPLHLGVALNASVFHSELLGDKTEGCKIARESFDTALGYLDTLDDDTYKDTALIMQLLRDFLAVTGDDETDEIGG